MAEFESTEADMAELQLQAEELEIQERRLSSELKACRTSRHRVKATIGNLQNRKAPISKLSDDVLTLIFQSGLETSGVTLMHNMPFSILISHVSARWRSIAICDPLLWTTVCITMSNLPASGLHKLYVERSKYLPLDIWLVCDQELPKTRSGETLLDRSMLQVHRCRNLNIHFKWFSLIYDFLRLLQDEKMPVLTGLSIKHVGRANHLFDHGEVEGEVIPLFTNGAPSLAQLSLIGISTRTCIPPLQGLTSLCLTANALSLTMSYAQFFRTLSTCSNTLMALELGGDLIFPPKLNDEEVGMQSGIFLPALHSLKVSKITQTEAIAKSIVAPVLRSLSLTKLTTKDFGVAMHILAGRQNPSGSRIESLALSDTDVRRRIDIFMTTCPGIKNLALAGTPVQRVLRYCLECDAKTKKYGDKPLWPQLYRIEVWGTSEGLDPKGLLQEVIQSRQDIGLPLRSTSCSDVSS